jgi:hypothetical protein
MNNETYNSGAARILFLYAQLAQNNMKRTAIDTSLYSGADPGFLVRGA